MILMVMLEGISKAATVLLVLMKVYTIPCYDRGYINVMLVLQSSSNSLHILHSSSSETNAAASSDCAYHIGNMEVEKNLDMQGEGEEVKVKTEKLVRWAWCQPRAVATPGGLVTNPRPCQGRVDLLVLTLLPLQQLLVLLLLTILLLLLLSSLLLPPPGPNTRLCPGRAGLVPTPAVLRVGGPATTTSTTTDTTSTTTT